MNRAPDIRQWASDRNLIEGSNSTKQFVKLIEEAGEIADGLIQTNHEAVKDGIGDTFVVLTIIAAQEGFLIEETVDLNHEELPRFLDELTLMAVFGRLAAGIARQRPQAIIDSVREAVLVLDALARDHGLQLNGCVEHAWDEIKDRKGRMTDGIFIKEEDLVGA